MGVKQEEFIKEFCDLWGDGTAESRPLKQKSGMNNTDTRSMHPL